MPLLKDLNCSIELSDCQQTLQEFGTSYGDGFVETFVPVPSKPQSFSIHLKSDTFIAPGIAMYVFIDGVYQCNRNRQNLKLRRASDGRPQIEFRVRQKEEKQRDGSMIARAWRFEKLNTVSAGEAPHNCSPDILANIGCIEVVVLRCAGPRNAKTACHMNMDGANDVSDHRLGFDGQSHEYSSDSIYDDRPPFSNGRGNGFGPPPPLGMYQSPYAETVNSRVPARSHHSTYAVDPSTHFNHKSSHGQSRHSGSRGPQARRPSGVPSFGVQYGSGPLPPVGKPFYHTDPDASVFKAPNIDPQWLEQIVTQAVKKGVEESQRNLAPVEASPVQNQHNLNVGTASQPPGAWPTSPYGVAAQPDKVVSSDQSAGERGTAMGQSQGGWRQRPPQSIADTRVTWHDAESGWGSTSTVNGWSTQEETPTDSWDTDEAWGAKRPSRWKYDDRKGRSRTVQSRSRHNCQAVSPVTIRIRDQRRFKDGVSVRLRSKSRSRRFKTDEDIPSFSEDEHGWTHNDITSSSAAEDSLDDTLQPSHSQSQAKTLQSRSQRRSHRSKSTNNMQRRSSKLPTAVQDWQTTLDSTSFPSNHIRTMPTVMNGPATVHASEFRDEPPNANIVPIPFQPAPYAPNLPDFAISKGDPNPFEAQSTSSLSWGGDLKTKKENDFWGPVTEKKIGWEDVSIGGWDTTDANKKAANWRKATCKTSWSTIDTKKDAGAGGWGTDNDAWGAKSLEEERKRTAGSLAGWNTKKSGWVADEKTTAPQAKRERLSYGHLDTNDEEIAPQWKTDTRWTTYPAEIKPTKDGTASKRHSNKSLSKYRQLRSASDTGPKPHWQFPPPTPKKNLHPVPEHNGPFDAPKEPLLKISKEAASEKGLEHQVRAGKGIQYGHVIGRPQYLDGLDKPYAVFRFKYRSRSTLQSLFGDTRTPSHGALTVRIPASNLAQAKDKLKDFPQDALIDKMLKLQTRLADKGYTGAEGKEERVGSGRRRDGEERGQRMASGSQGTEGVAQGLTE